MKKKFLIVFAVLLFTVFAIPSIQAQETSPEIRNAVVESITVEDTTIGGEPIGNASHFVYTFKLNKVNEWADRCYFKVWVDAVLVAEWSFGFSANVPPRCAGVYPEDDVGLVGIEILSAEFPYQSEDISGETYYSYRIHVYFDTAVFKHGEVRVAGDYMREPTYEGSELTVLKMQNSKVVDDVETFKYRTLKKIPPGWAK